MQKPHWSFKHTGTGIKKEQGSEKDEEPKEKPKDKDTAHETPAFNHKETSCWQKEESYKSYDWFRLTD